MWLSRWSNFSFVLVDPWSLLPFPNRFRIRWNSLGDMVPPGKCSQLYLVWNCPNGLWQFWKCDGICSSLLVHIKHCCALSVNIWKTCPYKICQKTFMDNSIVCSYRPQTYCKRSAETTLYCGSTQVSTQPVWEGSVGLVTLENESVSCLATYLLWRPPPGCIL